MVLAAGKVWCSPSSPCSRRSEALRVAPGGSAPPITSAARRDMLSSGRDGKAGASTELESWPGSGRKVHCIHNYHCPTLRGCHVLLCACDISNGEKKCLFKRAATFSFICNLLGPYIAWSASLIQIKPTDPILR